MTARLEGTALDPGIDAGRLFAWIRENPRRPAAAAFTAGIERQIAYWIEIAEEYKRAAAS